MNVNKAKAAKNLKLFAQNVGPGMILETTANGVEWLQW